MRNQIRALVIAPYPIFPAHTGGKIRIIEIARHLAELGLKVTIIEPFKIGSRYSLPLNKNLNLYSVKYPFLIPYFFTDKPFPYQFLISFHPAYKFFIRKYLSLFDIYQFEHPVFADLVDYIPQTKTVIYDAHNVEYDYVTSECRNRLVEILTTKRIYKYEGKLIKHSSKILVCSDNDKQRFIELYGVDTDKIEVIPNGIHELSITRSSQGKSAPAIFPKRSKCRRTALFSGSDVEHNRVAVRFILNNLAPQLRETCNFIIKGPCGKKFKRYNSENIFIDVEGGSIEPYIELSTVAIHPVTQGGGTNLKILDYLAHGLPVISTEFGIRGYDDLKQFVTICDLGDFSKEMTREHRLSPEVVGVLEKYLWRNSALKIKNIYSTLIDNAV